MRIGIYKDTLSNKRGADAAIIAFVEGLQERGYDAILFEKQDFASRMDESWDVIISTGTNELLDLYAHTSGRNFPWPVVQQFHTNPKSQFKWKRFRRNHLIKKALRRVCAIQVLSGIFVPQVARYGVKVVVIPNWCTDDAAVVNQPQSRDSSTKIIYPAFFGGKKNQRLLIKAFGKISRDFPEWTVELYGNGKIPKRLPERVIAKGFCNLREAYSECAFVAFPSLDEGFPMTLTEAAMFCKTFLAVKDWIGVGDGRGCLIADNTVSSYAEGLRRLMSNPGLCRELGRNAREICLSEYSKGKVLDMWLNLLAGARSADNRCEVRQ